MTVIDARSHVSSRASVAFINAANDYYHWPFNVLAKAWVLVRKAVKPFFNLINVSLFREAIVNTTDRQLRIYQRKNFGRVDTKYWGDNGGIVLSTDIGIPVWPLAPITASHTTTVGITALL